MSPTEPQLLRPREKILVDLSVAIAIRDPALSESLRTALLSGISVAEVMALISRVSGRAGDPRIAIHATAAALQLADGTESDTLAATENSEAARH
jgi:hypothetical protein